MDAAREHPVLVTVGHGTLDSDGLGALLQDAGVRRLVDVRRFPGSRTNPAAKRPALEDMAADRGVDYRWDERLGGRRRLAPDEPGPDSWWRVAQFRAYAAWTRTPDFRAGLERLLDDVRAARTAVMCSESVWWRCHRRLVADVVLAEQDVPVLHLMHDGRLTPHTVSDGARAGEDGRLVWDGPPGPGDS
ncbi:DUF488 family protein [Ornithinimicrobium pekingense]|uniref:DUF488 domain-containing protein n=1 Tax=Ornithinimicrobium pekingense TaxID=384677 RepID=A0ABQ2FAI5_9MICO|nr:DUF488 domain-containing protein [Ornithinimicrobium pekingense]GGK69856.1 hypothetical protein GCM10011509_17840 [Ornithinimicrobium pekingense]